MFGFSVIAGWDMGLEGGVWFLAGLWCEFMVVTGVLCRYFVDDVVSLWVVYLHVFCVVCYV